MRSAMTLISRRSAIFQVVDTAGVLVGGVNDW